MPGFHASNHLNPKIYFACATFVLAEGAQQIMQLPQSSQGSSGSLADSDTSGTKRHRTRFTPHQLSTMESAFVEEKYPDMKARQELSEKLGLSEIQVQVSRS